MGLNSKPHQSLFHNDEDRRHFVGVVVRVQSVAQPTAGQSVHVDSVVKLVNRLEIILKSKYRLYDIEITSTTKTISPNLMFGLSLQDQKP